MFGPALPPASTPQTNRGLPRSSRRQREVSSSSRTSPSSKIPNVASPCCRVPNTVSRSPKLQVLLCDEEAVIGLRERAKPFIGFCHQKAPACRTPTAHPAPELMQLTQPITIGIFNNHQGCVGHIDTNFDHRSGRRHRPGSPGPRRTPSRVRSFSSPGCLP